jgi:hypothetical protein
MGGRPFDLSSTCRQFIARYKIPEAIVPTDKVMPSLAGKADYHWARTLGVESSLTATDPVGR